MTKKPLPQRNQLIPASDLAYSLEYDRWCELLDRAGLSAGEASQIASETAHEVFMQQFKGAENENS